MFIVHTFNSGTQFNVLVKLFRLKTLKKCLPVEKLKNKKTKSCIKSSFLPQLYLYNTCMWRQFFASHTCNYIVILSFKEYFSKTHLNRQVAFELQWQCTRTKWMLFFVILLTHHNILSPDSWSNVTSQWRIYLCVVNVLEFSFSLEKKKQLQ